MGKKVMGGERSVSLILERRGAKSATQREKWASAKHEGPVSKARTATAREEGKSARLPLRNFVVTVQILYAVQYLIQ